MHLTQQPPYAYRTDPNVPAFDDHGPIAVMDAACGLCAKGARWIARNDWRNEFRIVPIQSPLGAALARHFDVDPEDPTTWLVVSDGEAQGGFDAMLWAAGRFGGRWRLLRVFRLVPRPIRDWVYGLVARHRYRIYGRTDLCAMPDPDVQARLLLDTPAACKTAASSA